MGKKIVIIEDDSFISKALQLKLSQVDVDLLVASDGAAGLKMVRDERPDLVLLDLIMPKMDGFEVLKNIKEDGSLKNIPVIILSNLGQEEEAKKGKDMGALEYYVKAETSLDTIVKKVEEVLA